MSIEQQCALLGLARSSYYYYPQPESQQNLGLLRRLDELYMEFPYSRPGRSKPASRSFRRSIFQPAS